MDLYHIHVLGTEDKLYKEDNEIVINDKVYKNRLYTRSKNTSFIVSEDRYPRLFRIVNEINKMVGFAPVGKYINIGDIMPFVLEYGSNEEIIKALEDSKRMLYEASFAKRELSVEEYRKDCESDKPSRMHSMFATTEDGVDYWKNNIVFSDADIYRVEPINEPFWTNEQLLPLETSSYEESYNSSKRYFNPRKKDLGTVSDEYLIQGRVKILEKVDEIRFKHTK